MVVFLTFRKYPLRLPDAISPQTNLVSFFMKHLWHRCGNYDQQCSFYHHRCESFGGGLDLIAWLRLTFGLEGSSYGRKIEVVSRSDGLCTWRLFLESTEVVLGL